MFGDGFFTTGIVENGLLLHPKYHFERLIESARRLKFEAFDVDQLIETLYRQVKEVEHACIRVTVSRIQQARGYGFSKSTPIQVCIQLSQLPDCPAQYCELFFAKTPISSNPILAGLKHLNRLDSVLAAQEIKSMNQESLMCLGEHVISGSRSNIFVFQDGEWLTPGLDRAGIAGITRKRLIESMRNNNIEIRESNITRKQLLKSKAMLLTNSLVGIWPVAKIGNILLDTELSECLKSKLDFAR